MYPVADAAQAVRHLRGEAAIEPAAPAPFLPFSGDAVPDFSDVRGQPRGAPRDGDRRGRRAQHPVDRPAGHGQIDAGKAPAGHPAAAASRGGPSKPAKSTRWPALLRAGGGLVGTRPFRAPHHSVSATALSGGGSTPRPGEVSLAHNGVLFLDELPEFSRDALEILRQPLEDGRRHRQPRGRLGQLPVRSDAGGRDEPLPLRLLRSPHPPVHLHAVRHRPVSAKGCPGPLLDRIDLHVEVMPVGYDEISGEEKGEDSASIRARVVAAREVQNARYKGTGISCNARLTSAALRRVLPAVRAGEHPAAARLHRYGPVRPCVRPPAQGQPHHRRPRRQRAHRGVAHQRGIQYRSLDRKILVQPLRPWCGKCVRSKEKASARRCAAQRLSL